MYNREMSETKHRMDFALKEKRFRRLAYFDFVLMSKNCHGSESGMEVKEQLRKIFVDEAYGCNNIQSGSYNAVGKLQEESGELDQNHRQSALVS